MALNLRDLAVIHAGNRFVIYALFPQYNISIYVSGLSRKNTSFTTIKSIFGRSSATNFGVRMFKFGGGSHQAESIYQIRQTFALAILAEFIEEISGDG